MMESREYESRGDVDIKRFDTGSPTPGGGGPGMYGGFVWYVISY